MKGIIKKIATALGLASREKNRIWVIIFRRKPELVGENDVGETYICSSPFGTEYEAMRHKESLEKELQGFDIIDIVPIVTKEDVTVSKYDYTISTEHPKITMTYERP